MKFSLIFTVIAICIQQKFAFKVIYGSLSFFLSWEEIDCIIVTQAKISHGIQVAPKILRASTTPTHNSHLMHRSGALRMSGVETSLPTTGPKKSAIWEAYLKTTDILTNLFPLWTVLFAGLAIVRPESFAWFTTKYFTWCLGLLMLSMGITLTPADFVRVVQQPGAVIIGFILCYVLCPLLGLGLGKAFNLPVEYLAGLALVGSVNGGQASNLCTYIAKGDVALSVLMTTVTTVAGIFVTPLLCKALLGAVVPVDAVGIAMSCLQVVLAPIILGMTANKFFPKAVEVILPVTPVVGVVSTCVLVASAVAQVAPQIASAGLALQLPVMLLHLVGRIKFLNLNDLGQTLSFAGWRYCGLLDPQVVQVL